MGLDDIQSVAKEAQGSIAVHPALMEDGWGAMDAKLRQVRRLLDLKKETLPSLPFYALTHGPKRAALLEEVQKCGIVPPARANKERLAWLIVNHRAHNNGGDVYLREVQRLTCVHCKVCYFAEDSGAKWVCCSQRGCYQWNHVECERVDAQRVEQEKKFKCRACLQRNVANEDDEEVEKTFSSWETGAVLQAHHLMQHCRDITWSIAFEPIVMSCWVMQCFLATMWARCDFDVG